jgi:hypothetical protein
VRPDGQLVSVELLLSASLSEPAASQVPEAEARLFQAALK